MSKEEEGQVIQYIDGWAYGVTPEGKTVCLGTRDAIKYLLSSHGGKSDNPIIAQIIALEKKLTKGDGLVPPVDIHTRRMQIRRAKKAGISLKAQRKLEASKEVKLKYKKPKVVSKRLRLAKHEDVCPVCRKNPPKSIHHITPVLEGGKESPRNMVKLCISCHDIVEEYTNKGKPYSPVLIELIRLSGRV